MFKWLISRIKLLLPLWVVYYFYRRKKSLPVALLTPSGNKYKLIMIDVDYGLVINQDKYNPNRLDYLKRAKIEIEMAQKELLDELNSLTFEQRELIQVSDGDIQDHE